jgi:3'-phosphoadenosine 5'-phosphosulfate sulfotransferase (PAPS reductase)/FAD synthetase
MFPSPTLRQCTSDLKRGPIERTIRRYTKASGNLLIVNCMGMRAQESSARSKLVTLKLHAGNSKAGREWYDWLPIHTMLIEEVFATISAAGQEPHWAYAAGMTRLSCCFCIMASKEDLTTAAKLNPTLYARYVALEESTGQVMMMPTKRDGKRSLEQITGIQAIRVVVQSN